MAQEIIFSEGNFAFVKKSGIGAHDTPWEGLEVISSGNAEKHVVTIQLDSLLFPRFNGKPVRYTYNGVYVKHGNRGVSDTLNDTIEYIEVLQEAVRFSKKVIDWLNQNPQWKDWIDCI